MKSDTDSFSLVTANGYYTKVELFNNEKLNELERKINMQELLLRDLAALIAQAIVKIEDLNETN
jgi:hypothetical protein